MFNPGRLDTRCTFYESVAVTDEYGDFVYTWDLIPLAPSWCRFEPLKGMELTEFRKIAANHHAKITVRRCEAITTAAKVDVMGERWDVTSIEDYGRSGWQRLWIERTT